MLEMYGESWETSLSLIRVQDQSKYFWKDICVIIDVVMRCRSKSWWKWLGESILFFCIGKIITESKQGKIERPYISGDLLRFRKTQYLNK